MTRPLVSVLMTAYNRREFFAEAIESVLAQTFTDFEFHIVDDASTDGSIEIAHRYAHDPRLTVHVNRENLGDYRNRNHAASLARGTYLKYVDTDDLLHPDCLAVMVSQMERFPEAGVGFSKEIFAGVSYPFMLGPADTWRLHFLGGGMLTDGATMVIIRREVFEAAGGFPTDIINGDVIGWQRFTRRRGALFIREGLIHYRIHEGQMSASAALKSKALLADAQLLRSYLAMLDGPDCPLDERERHQARRNFVGIYLRIIGRHLLRGEWSAAHSRWRLAGLEPAMLRWLPVRSRFPYDGHPELLALLKSEASAPVAGP